ncbi:MAG: helix-turn-helix transcriptional regulator [Acidobacteriaceae bacterium]
MKFAPMRTWVWEVEMKVSLERLTEVKSRTGLCKSAIYDLISKGKFPKPVSLSPGGRCVGCHCVSGQV